MNKIDLNKEQLEKLYSNLNITVKEIAEIFGVSRWTIRRRAKEYKLKMRITPFQKGDKNWGWKGDKTEYKGIHIWLRKNYSAPNKCEICGIENKPLELASKNGTHKRDITYYQWLCHKCHIHKDGVLDKLNAGRKKWYDSIYNVDLIVGVN